MKARDTSTNGAIFGSDLWRVALEKYASATHLTVTLFDADARVVFGPVHPTPLFQLFDEFGYDPGILSECARRCIAQTKERPPVFVAQFHGLAVVGASLGLEGKIVGAAVGGYAFADFLQASDIQQLAKQSGIAFARIWEIARKQPPVPQQRLIVHGELLQVLGDALLRENYRTRQYEQAAAIINSSDDAISSEDLNGVTTSWNAGAERLFGYPASETIGKPLARLIHPEALDDERGILERVRRDEKIDHYETVYRRNDRSSIEISLTASPITDANGSIVGMSRIARDITERKRAQAALRDSESRYRILFEATGTPYLVLAADAPRFTITDVNSAYLNVTMTQREALMGRGVFEVFPSNPADPAAVGVRDLKASFERVLETGRPDAMAVLKYDIRRPDGTFEERYWIPHNTPIFDGANEPTGIVHHAEDVTDYIRLRARGVEHDRETERLAAEVVAAGKRLQQANDRLRASEANLEAELAATRRLQEVSSTLVHEGDTEALYGKIIDAAATIMDSDAASMQMLHFGREELFLLGSKGFHPESAIFWQWVRLNLGTTCGAAMHSGERMVVPDVETCDFMAGTRDLDEYRRSSVRAVQSTPLVSRGGRLLGMVSTHWRVPHDPPESDLRRLDLLARQAADLIERAQAEQMLSDSEEQLRLATEAADVGLWDVDPVNDKLFWPARVKAMFGISPEVPVSMADFYTGLHPEDRERARAAFAEAVDPSKRAVYDVEYRTVGREDHVVRWVAAKGRGVFDATGTCVRIIGTAIDITARKLVEEHRELLINELNHRVKNTLATVQSFASQTLRNAKSTAEARDMFDSRLMALAKAHDVLTRQHWEGADLNEVVSDAIAAYSENGRAPRFQISGPELRLLPKSALALSMALHELATNAVKHGALSNGTGVVKIEWHVSQNEQQQRFRLRWTESGGPAVEKPRRRGFGSRLVEQGLGCGDDLII